MKKTRKKILADILLMAIVSISFIMSFVWQHETTHQTIYEHFGINSTIELHPLSAATIPNETEIKDLMKESMSEFYTMEYMQIETEIVGYHLFPMFTVLLCVLLVFLIKR